MLKHLQNVAKMLRYYVEVSWSYKFGYFKNNYTNTPKILVE